MLPTQYDQLPTKIKSFIDATKVPHVYIDVHRSLDKISIKINNSSMSQSRIYVKFDLRTADTARLWWANH